MSFRASRSTFFVTEPKSITVSRPTSSTGRCLRFVILPKPWRKIRPVRGLANLVAGEPSRLGDLSVVERKLLIRIANGMEADHQRARERPWLAAQIPHIPDGQADFFANLPGDTDFERLAGLDEPGQ